MLRKTSGGAHRPRRFCHSGTSCLALGAFGAALGVRALRAGVGVLPSCSSKREAFVQHGSLLNSSNLKAKEHLTPRRRRLTPNAGAKHLNAAPKALLTLRSE